MNSFHDSTMADHEQWMKRCLQLAENGQKYVGNGAMVGAVLVSKNKEIAQGWHAKFGAPHAEAALLSAYRGPIGAEDILYVNLEPCIHHGKTPPCTEAILARGIRRLCIGMVDSDSRNAGKGIERLRASGLEIIGPVAQASCEYANRGFVSLRRRGRPWVTLRTAQTRDGRFANDDGSPLKITCPTQDVWTHTYLRSRHDAMLVGVETVVRDNPILDTRLVQTNPQSKQEKYQPWRIILDPKLRVPLTAKVISDVLTASTIVVYDTDERGVRSFLAERGVHCMKLGTTNGVFDLHELLTKLSAPDGTFPGIASLLVEGGPHTWRAFRDAHVVDEEVMLMGR